MRLRVLLVFSGLAVILVGAGLGYSDASAGTSPGFEAAVLQSPRAQVDDESCLFCHAEEGLSTQLESGETLPLTIDPDLYDESVHGSNGVTCVTCHSNIDTYPHPEPSPESLREVTMEYSATCQECHTEQFHLTLDSVHQDALNAGNPNAALCSDCHDPHTQQPLTDEAGNLTESARVNVAETCAQCHNEIFNTYEGSVHGHALLDENNPDVPTCTDCHGVHNIQDPTTASFRNSTPALCAECHTDEALMSKYGLSTNVLDTYVADFHGTTVTIFEKTFPDQPTNKPVCTDCHGVHDIASGDDPQKGLKTRENLLARCQVCHPDATANFPDAWMSHYTPSPDKYVIVYYVNLFYKYFIPAVLIPMLILVSLDFGRAMINRYRRSKGNKAKAAAEKTEEVEAPPPDAPAPPEESNSSDEEVKND